MWLYAGSVPTQVRVVALDYDFWYELGAEEDTLDPDEVPNLNNEGNLYYVRHRSGWREGEPFWPDSLGFHTKAEAMAAAEAAIPASVEWR
jgi:hypothetical protein